MQGHVDAGRDSSGGNGVSIADPAPLLLNTDLREHRLQLIASGQPYIRAGLRKSAQPLTFTLSNKNNVSGSFMRAITGISIIGFTLFVATNGFAAEQVLRPQINNYEAPGSKRPTDTVLDGERSLRQMSMT